MARNVSPNNKGNSARAAAAHIDVSTVRFYVLLNKGVIERKTKASGGYNLDEVRRAYVRHLRAIASGHGSGMADLAKARALLAREQTRLLERKNAVARGELVSVKAVASIVISEFSVIRDRLLGIAGNICDALAHQDRESVFAGIYREVMEVLNELPDPEDVARRAAQRRQQRSR
jgi:phage terminase Nu1 subunit (DNA packaging protein)